MSTPANWTSMRREQPADFYPAEFPALSTSNLIPSHLYGYPDSRSSRVSFLVETFIREECVSFNLGRIYRSITLSAPRGVVSGSDGKKAAL